jgi:threonine dehydrogenase-like Zn-dependent dehydrogenase
MQAAVLASPRRFEVRQVPIPAVGNDEVRVKIEYCGICSSNIAPWIGAPWFSYPFAPGAPGHEGVGVLEAVGSGVTGVTTGERVAVLSYNAFAEYDVAKSSSVVLIGDLGFPFLGEPLGCAWNIYHRSGVREGDWVAIVGIGFLGAILVQLATSHGAKVIAISRRPEVLKLASNYGADFTFQFKDRGAIVKMIKDLTKERLCDVVIEAGGVQETLDLAGDLTKTKGRLIVAGYHQGGPRSVNIQEWNWKGIDVINAHEREEAIYVDGIRAAADAVCKGQISLSGLISGTFPLTEIEQGFLLAEQKPEGFIKGIVQMM